MALFTYKAIDKQGKNVEGDLEAVSSEDVASYLNNKGMLLISVVQKKEEGTGAKNTTRKKEKLSLLDRQVFFENLATMLKAGIPLVEAIKMLREDAEKPSIQRLLMDLQFTLEKGIQFSVAMENYPNLFTPVVINLTRAGELSGNLEKTMEVVSVQFRKDLELRKKIMGAMMYPIILVCMSGAVLLMLLIFVVPRLSQFFSQSKMELPVMTKFVIKLGALLSGSPIFDISIVAGIIAFVIFIRRSPKVRLWVFDFVSRLPLLSKLIRYLYLYRYCWIMGILLESGVDILKSIDITSNVIASRRYYVALQDIYVNVSKGTPLGDSIRQHPKLFPNLVGGLTAVGEKTGTIEKIYKTLARFFERNFSSTLQSLVKVIEPLMLVVMGGVVGGIALSIVLPIYQFVSGGVH